MTTDEAFKVVEIMLETSSKSKERFTDRQREAIVHLGVMWKLNKFSPDDKERWNRLHMTLKAITSNSPGVKQ